MDNYEKTKAGQMEKATCKELANTAGKIINTLRAELDFMALTGTRKNISFLNTGEETTRQITDGAQNGN